MTNPRKKAIIQSLNKRRKIGKTKSYGVKPSVSIIIEYTRDLKNMVDFVYNSWIYDLTIQVQGVTLRDSAETEGVKIIERNIALYLKTLDTMQKSIARRYTNRGNDFNRRSFITSIKKAIGVDIGNILTEKGVASELNEAIIRNTRYIKAVGNDLNHQIQTAVQIAVKKGINTKDDLYNLKNELMKYRGMGYNRAKLIAVDQMNKLNGNLNRIRQTNIGITSYEWSDSEDSHVRPLHEKYNGNIYRWDSPPSDGHPGEAVRCRCIPKPNIEEFLKYVNV